MPVNIRFNSELLINISWLLFVNGNFPFPFYDFSKLRCASFFSYLYSRLQKNPTGVAAEPLLFACMVSIETVITSSSGRRCWLQVNDYCALNYWRCCYGQRRSKYFSCIVILNVLATCRYTLPNAWFQNMLHNIFLKINASKFFHRAQTSLRLVSVLR